MGHEHAQGPTHGLRVAEELAGQASSGGSRTLAEQQPDVRASGCLLAGDRQTPNLVDSQPHLGAAERHAADPGPLQDCIGIHAEFSEQVRQVRERCRGHVLAGMQRPSGDGLDG